PRALNGVAIDQRAGSTTDVDTDSTSGNRQPSDGDASRSTNQDRVQGGIWTTDSGMATAIQGEEILSGRDGHVLVAGAGHADGPARRGAVDRSLQCSRVFCVTVNLRPSSRVIWKLRLSCGTRLDHAHSSP